jgi:glycine cleavage system H lipoate-binding protein
VRHYWNTTHGSGWIVQVQPTDAGLLARDPEYHPRQGGGSFRCGLRRRLLACGPEYHPLQWVDRSSPAYKGRRLDRFFEYHPRQWVDRSSPFDKRRRLDRFFEYHPRAVGGSFKSSLQTTATRPLLLNTTHGSGWIVQVQPTEGGLLASIPEYHPRQWVDRSSPAYKRRRLAPFFEYHPRQWVDRSGAAYRGRTSRFHPRIPTHGSGWIVQVQPTNDGDSTASLNTTHGSGWIVQVQPTNRAGAALCFVIALACSATEEQMKTRIPVRSSVGWT